MTDEPFPLDEHWRGWLGSIAVENLADCNLLLVAKLHSKTPTVLDGESQTLKQRVYNAYVGLQLAGMFATAHKPLLLTGGLEEGELSVKSQEEYDAPTPSTAVPYPFVSVAQLEEGIRLGAGIQGIVDAKIPGGHWRLFRTLRIYTETRATHDIIERVHQFSRCIDGLILPAIANTKSQFKSKTELFIGPKHHDLLGEIYDIRSADEHLNDNLYLEVFNRGARMEIVRKEMIVEHIVRTALARIIGTPALWPHFANHDALDAFWKLTPVERRAIWGAPIDLKAATAEFDPKYISDGDLGAA